MIQIRSRKFEVNRGFLLFLLFLLPCNAHSEDKEKLLNPIETQLKDIQAKQDELQKNMDIIRSDLDKLGQDSRASAADITNLRSQVEDNSVKLFETLMRVEENSKKIEGLPIETQLKDIQAKQDELQKNMDIIRSDNAADITNLRSQVEDNSVKLFETLMRVGENSKKIDELQKNMDITRSEEYKIQESQKNLPYGNGFWLPIIAMVAFLMPLGFTAFEAGKVRARHIPLAGMKNLLVWIVILLAYSVLGFGIMYGESVSGWIGSSFTLWKSSVLSLVVNDDPKVNVPLPDFLLYQIALAATAGLIVSTALSDRLPMIAYALIALFLSVIVYPVFGHWAWSSHLLSGNQGWLESLGFRDFAGSTAVHSLAAWFALVWAQNRWGKLYSAEEAVARPRVYPHNMIYSVLGVFILWLGWIGLNAGSQLNYDAQVVSLVVLNTSLAGAAAGLTAFYHNLTLDDKDSLYRYRKTLGGVLGGFVAVSAACNTVIPLEAIVIGGIAGVIYPLAYAFLNKVVIKDNYQDSAASIIAAHGFCGVWGTLCVAIFGTEGLFALPDLKQLLVQMEGVVAAFIFSALTAFALRFIYLGVSRWGSTVGWVATASAAKR
jgi:Amt family ammonium transporter